MSIYKGTTLIAGALPNAANQDLSNLSQTGQAVIDGKADTDLTNTTDSAKVLMSGMAMPSTKYIDLTLGASGSTYTAPANGWVLVACTGTSGSTYMEISSDYSSACASYNGGWGRAMAPVKKGFSFNIHYGGNNFKMKRFRFVYAQGSESEAQ